MKEEDYWLLVDFVNGKLQQYSGPLGIGKGLALSNLQRALDDIPKADLKYRVSEVDREMLKGLTLPANLMEYTVGEIVDALKYALSRRDIR